MFERSSVVFRGPWHIKHDIRDLWQIKNIFGMLRTLMEGSANVSKVWKFSGDLKKFAKV